MLEWNRSRVQGLTGLEIWLFIIGRVLVRHSLDAGAPDRVLLVFAFVAA